MSAKKEPCHLANCRSVACDGARHSGAAVFLTWPELATLTAALRAYSLAYARETRCRLSDLEAMEALILKLREVASG